MKLVCYCRTSTNEQRDNGAGIATQEAEAKRWAKVNGHRIAAVYRDEALSGTLGEDERPGLASALLDVIEGRAQGIVAQHPDRLSRTLHGQEAIFRKVWDHQGKVFSTSGEVLEDDPDDPTRTFVRQILGAAAELERGMIRARMRAGARRKREAGGYAGGGIPYGMRTEGATLIADTQERKALSLMRSLKGEGLSLREIAKELDKRGLAPRKGEHWHPHSVNRILMRARGNGYTA